MWRAFICKMCLWPGFCQWKCSVAVQLASFIQWSGSTQRWLTSKAHLAFLGWLSSCPFGAQIKCTQKNGRLKQLCLVAKLTGTCRSPASLVRTLNGRFHSVLAHTQWEELFLETPSQTGKMVKTTLKWAVWNYWSVSHPMVAVNSLSNGRGQDRNTLSVLGFRNVLFSSWDTSMCVNAFLQQKPRWGAERYIYPKHALL